LWLDFDYQLEEEDMHKLNATYILIMDFEVDFMMGHLHFATNFMIQKSSQIIYILKLFIILNYKIINVYIIVNFIKFNLYHVDTCHYIG
jgi:hypothetical protein